jgi:phage tail-like protein
VKSLDGGDPSRPHPSPESTKHEAITLGRGLTHDPEFARWARQGANLGPQLRNAVEPEGLRQDLRLEVFDETGQPVLAYTLFRCRVSEFQVLADLDAQANAVLIEMIRLENEGWERVALLK